jgi:hypothetical protein
VRRRKIARETIAPAAAQRVARTPGLSTTAED